VLVLCVCGLEAPLEDELLEAEPPPQALILATSSTATAAVTAGRLHPASAFRRSFDAMK